MFSFKVLLNFSVFLILFLLCDSKPFHHEKHYPQSQNRINNEDTQNLLEKKLNCYWVKTDFGLRKKCDNTRFNLDNNEDINISAKIFVNLEIGNFGDEENSNDNNFNNVAQEPQNENLKLDDINDNLLNKMSYLNRKKWTTPVKFTTTQKSLKQPVPTVSTTPGILDSLLIVSPNCQGHLDEDGMCRELIDIKK